LGVRGEELPPKVDLLVYDFAVNSGPGTSLKRLQEVMEILADRGWEICVDTRLTDNELRCLQDEYNHNPEKLLHDLIANRADKFRGIVKANPTQKVNLPNWMSRLRKLSVEVLGTIPDDLNLAA
jgi:lysozyme family protein